MQSFGLTGTPLHASPSHTAVVARSGSCTIPPAVSYPSHRAVSHTPRSTASHTPHHTVSRAAGPQSSPWACA